MKEEDIISYSLRVLEEMIEDALGAECEPDEIFNTIKLAAKRNANYHRICARDAQSLVDLLEGVDRTNKVVSINSGIKIDDVDRERFELKSDCLTDSTQWPDYTELGIGEEIYEDLLPKGWDNSIENDDWRRIEDPNLLQKNSDAIVNIPKTLTEAINLSKQNNPDIKIAKLDLAQSEKDLAISESDLKPTASVSIERSYSDDFSATYDRKEKDTLKATLNWPFYSGGKKQYTINKNSNLTNRKRLLLDDVVTAPNE